MTIRKRRIAAVGWALISTVLLGVVFFGAVQTEVRHVFVALVLCLGGALLLLTPEENRPGRAWLLVALGFPLWLSLQLLPLPHAIVSGLSPRAAAWLAETWPGPAVDCSGAVLLAEQPPRQTLSVDPTLTRETLFIVVSGLLAFFGTRAFVAHGGGARRRKLLTVLAAFASAQAIYGIGQWVAETPRVLWVVKSAYPDCASGTLINRNHFALLMYVGLGATLALLLERIGRDPEELDPQRETAIRVTLGVALGLEVVAILSSKSRGGIVGAGLVLLSGLPALWRAPRRVRWAMLAVLLSVVLPVLALVGGDIGARMADISKEWSGRASRGTVLRLSGPYLRDFALTGSGGGTFEVAFPRYRDSSIVGLYDYAHDDYLQVALETGALGLALALAPLVLFGIDYARWRARVRSDAARPPDDVEFEPPIPVLFALVAVMLHEFVDFGLQMPALGALFAVVAAIAAPPLRARPAARLAIGWALAGFLLAGPAAMHSVARWPIVGDIRLPDLPDQRHARAGDALRAWQKNEANRALACNGLANATRARALRPLSARYALTHARLLVAAAERQDLDPKLAERLNDEARRGLGVARSVDPWDGFLREGVMNTALALGDLDAATADALAAATVNPDSAASVVQSLLQLGLPPTALARAFATSPVTFTTVLAAMVESGDLASAGRVVPADVQPDPVFCRSGLLVRTVLEKVHHLHGESFLEGCMNVPGIRGTDLEPLVAGWIATAWIEEGNIDKAVPWIPRMAECSERTALEMSVAETHGSWKDVIRLGERLLTECRALGDSPIVGLYHYRLGIAYAHEDQLVPARQELEAARALDPRLNDVDRMLSDIAIGKNPVR